MKKEESFFNKDFIEKSRSPKGKTNQESTSESQPA